MGTKIARIAEIAKERPNEVFTSIYHLINEELLRECHKELDGSKATGIDDVTKAEYEENLDKNIANLHERLARMGYRPTPAKRIYIPKANGKVRGIAYQRPRSTKIGKEIPNSWNNGRWQGRKRNTRNSTRFSIKPTACKYIHVLYVSAMV